MVSIPFFDSQSDATSGAKSSEMPGQSLVQSVFRTSPTDFLSAIQDMTSSKSGMPDFLQPIMLFGGNDSTAGNSGQSGSSESGSNLFNPIDMGPSFAFTTNGNNLTSFALPMDSQSPSSSSSSDSQLFNLPMPFSMEGNSGQTANLPESSSGLNLGSSDSALGQSANRSEGNTGQTAALPDTSSSGQETNVGQTAVAPDSSSAQPDVSQALTPNASFDRMPQIGGANNNGDGHSTQWENKILAEIQELIQLLENKWHPQPTPTPLPEPGPLKGDVASIQQPDATTNQITYKTTDGQIKTAPLPSTYDGTGSYALHSDGVLAYYPDASGGQEYLDDSKNPPQWIDFDGPRSQSPSGDVVASFKVGGGQVESIEAPASNAKTMQIKDSHRVSQEIPTPPDYNGTGQFLLYQNGVLAYSGPDLSTGGEYYYDQAIKPPGWVNNDVPNPGPNAPRGSVVKSWSPTAAA